MQVVWFKRDLRVWDNQALSEAAESGEVLPIFIHEPEIICAPDYSAQHDGFIGECLAELSEALALRGVPLLQLTGNAKDAIEAIWQEQRFTHLWSHEEVGNWASYERDKTIATWCRIRGVTWHQIPQNGVIRGSREHRTRVNWLARLEDYMAETPIPAPLAIRPTAVTGNLLEKIDKPVPSGIDKAARMRGGRLQAEQLVANFVNKRIMAYPKAISSPLTAETGCSRLSPYLAYGVLSAREIVAAMNERIESPEAAANPYERERLITAFRFFADRLRWRCGYFQNMEGAPFLEFENLDRKMDGLRETEFNQDYFTRWKEGQTGYPMVDAAMTMLRHTGWINMRMRGMLLSFAVNDLWLHWREPALFLANEFLDYEPAIHYNQMQIHAGTAGADHSLTYNVVKQAQDLDPMGVFVRRWLSALKDVPQDFIFEPWTMPSIAQEACGVKIGKDYPSPVVDHVSAGRRARNLVAEAKATPSGKVSPHIRRRQEESSNAGQLGLF